MIKTALIYFILDYYIDKLENQLQLNLSNPFDAIVNATMIEPEAVGVGNFYDVMVFAHDNFRDDFISGITAPDRMTLVFYECSVIRDDGELITIEYSFRLYNAEYNDKDSMVDAIEEISTGQWGSRVSICSHDEDLGLIALEVDNQNYLVKTTYTRRKADLIGAYKI